jgi:hypothetical protein
VDECREDIGYIIEYIQFMRSVCRVGGVKFFIDKRFLFVIVTPHRDLSGRNSVVECHLAKVDVDGSSPFARSIFSPNGGIAKWLRQRSAKPLFPGSNPDAASRRQRGQRSSACPLFLAHRTKNINIHRQWMGQRPCMEEEMKIQVRKGSLAEHVTAAGVVTLFEGETGLDGAAALLNKRSGDLIGEILRMGDFTGRTNQIAVLYARADLPVRRIVVVGLGKRLDFSPDRLRGAFARAAQQIRSLNIGEFAAAINIPNVDLPLERMVEAAVEGVVLGLYRFLPFKTVDREPSRELTDFTILESDERLYKTIRSAAKTAEIVAAAVNFARDIVPRRRTR